MLRQETYEELGVANEVNETTPLRMGRGVKKETIRPTAQPRFTCSMGCTRVISSNNAIDSFTTLAPLVCSTAKQLRGDSLHMSFLHVSYSCGSHLARKVIAMLPD